VAAERILVTGANGFIGRGLVRELRTRGREVLGAVRRGADVGPGAGVENYMVVGEIGPESVWDNALKDVSTVVHLAGRAHVLKETLADPLVAYRLVNVAGTEKLARSAAAAGVERLIFLSSIGVNGNNSGIRPFNETDLPKPHNDYTTSKWEAEQLLITIGKETGMEIVIIRPPLVYGPGVKANFLALLGLVSRGTPLPFGRVNNLRSLLGLDNLVDFIILCIDQPAAAGETFLLADGEDISTPDLIRMIAASMGRPARLLPVPPAIMALAGRLIGRYETWEKVCGSLRLDTAKVKNCLGWRPVLGMAEGIERTVRWYKQSGHD